MSQFGPVGRGPFPDIAYADRASQPYRGLS
jgi:hypothetical protein